MADEPDRTHSTAYAWYVVAILTLASVSGNVDRQILIALVGPIKREFGVTDVQISYLIGLAFAVFYAVLGLPIARLADRSSRRNIMGTGITLWSLFTALCATARTYGGLLALRIGVGVGEATINAPSVSLLADYFPRERLSRAMSVYSLGIFAGSGVGYMIGGWVIHLVALQGSWTVPLFGTIRPWQTAFLVVGLPGLLIAALLFLTVREPPRREPKGPQLPIRVLIRYVVLNRRTFATHAFGFALSALVNYAIAAWLPSFFARTYGWEEASALRVQGLLTSTIGVVGVLAGGWASDWFVRRGHVDGPLRVGMIGAAGMLVSASAYPLMPTATLAIVWLAVVNFFAAFPWGAAYAAAAEIAPAPLRAQGAALFFFVLILVSGVFGPTSVAVLTDHVFSEATIRYSLVVVNVLGMTAAIALFASGLGAYRRTVANREQWKP
jgi:MFS family permease